MKWLLSIGWMVVVGALGTSAAWGHGGGGMGGITEGDVCSRERGQYIIHFSAYQHATEGPASQLAQLRELKDADLKRYVDALKEEFQSFCRDIPNTGKVTLTFDLISDALRRVPVAVRIVEASEGGNGETILSVPLQVYPSGVIRGETEFPRAGKYLAVVDVEEPGGRSHLGGVTEAAGHSHDGEVGQKHSSTAEEEVYHAHDSSLSFPFTVGLKKASRKTGAAASLMSNPAIIVTTIAGVAVGAVLYVRRKKKLV